MKYWNDVIAQDIVFEVKNICYKLAVYYSPSLGKTYGAKLPKGASYYSTNLQSFIITFNKVLDVTEAKILMLLESIDIKISKGSISNILLKYADIAYQEKQEILKAGLASSYENKLNLRYYDLSIGTLKKITDFIALYWKYYHKLLAYKKTPTVELAHKMSVDFDELFTTKTNFFQLDKLIEKTFKTKIDCSLY